MPHPVVHPSIVIPQSLDGGLEQTNPQYNFSPSNLNGASLNNPTSIQFGPDGRLYVGQLNGLIQVLTIKRNADNNYAVTATDVIYLVDYIPNHDDDGTVNTTIPTRQITSILVKGTAAQPLLYVTSSDNRMGGPAGDLNLDTNSGILSLLTKTGSTWQKIDLVRGLPRSEENHSPNGMQMNESTSMIYLAVGGFTNAGAPSTNFAYASERALSAAVLSIDIKAIMAMPTKGTGNNAYKYDLPTVDDPTRPNNSDSTDVNDPFGGNNGLNQAKLVRNGPVQIFSAGYRNSYDLLITKTPGRAGRMYTIDNGANEGWGGYPENEGPAGNATNNYLDDEPGSTSPSANHPIVNNLDNLHYIGNIATYKPGSFYGGHPNPIRANPAGAGLYTYNNGTTGVWRTSKTGANPLPADWPPVPIDMANPVEGQFLMPGVQDSALLTFSTSTNGLAEYTASNFNNTLKGNILAAGLNTGEIFRIIPTTDGKDVLNKRLAGNKLNQDLPFASGFGSEPLDVIAQGDSDVFAGTVWVATYGSEGITIFEPQDFVNCTGKYDTLDDDHDGYTNMDEVDNGTQPCSAASTPPDFDNDKISDLNDPDDDNDGIPDQVDFFPIDPNNGSKTPIPVNYDFYNNSPQKGFFGLGFTGLMCNKKPDNNYLKLFSQDSLIAGGAVGAFTLTAVSKGDALGTLNNQENAFQFGIKLDSKTSPFTLHSRMLGPFFNGHAPVNYQSQGMYIGAGDQSNYLKIVMNANGGAGGIEVVYENADVPVSYQFPLPAGNNRSTLDLFLGVDPISGTVQPRYSSNGGTVLSLGSPIPVGGLLLDAIQARNQLAAGIISTSRGATSFIATWDYMQISYDSVTANGSWQIIVPSSGGFIEREENAFIDAGDKFYLIGGRGISAIQVYDPAGNAWTNRGQTPVELNHFQALTIGGLVYAPGAFTGAFPHETPVPVIYVYNPVRDKWLTGTTVPPARRRGAGGAVSYKNKIYLVGGIKDGHYAGWVKWFDEYDPSTNTWKVLPDAPRARDHFHAVVINDKMYVAGGRRSSDSTGEVWNLTVPEVDVYDFTIGQWSTLPSGSNIPTPRAGAATQVLGNELVVIGGESAQPAANIETEALNVQTNTWRRVADMQQRRHGTQAIKSNNGLYVAAGAGLQGGANLLTSMEAFYLFNPTIPNNAAITASQLTAILDSSFKTTPLNSVSNRTITLSNKGGTQDIMVSSIALSGSAAFTDSIPYALPFVVPAGRTVVLSVTFKPQTSGPKSATLVVNHSGLGDSIATELSADVSIPFYRINAGGGLVTNSIGRFAADTFYSPVPGTVLSTVSSITATADSALYQTGRTSVSDTFNYAFPLNNGDYTVVMHFAELKYKAAGSRVFDVSAEGSKVLNDYDIFKKAGFLAATTEIFPVTVSDGLLNLRFSSLAADGGVDQPAVSAIEIYGLAANNQPPAANAGADTMLMLPAASLVLHGSGTDAGGMISSYTWTQVSGPNTAVFSSKLVAAPAVSRFITGTYTFSLVVTDNVGAASPADQVVVTVVNPLPATGLNYRYYEGTWNSLPDFNTLTPVKTGTSPNIDLGIRNRADSFGIVWEGNIFIPAPGAYTFETVSDEGSRFYFNSLYSPSAMPLVNNDSLHLARAATGTVTVPAAGMYPVAITYFDKADADTMKIYWTGPGITRQLIPAAYFGTKLQIDTTAPTVPANLHAVYAGNTFVHLDWNDATDSVGVTGYDIFVNGIKKYTATESAITADSLQASTTYIFSVKARDKAGNSSAAGSVISTVTTASTTGLSYRCYEGAWNALPNFNTLTPVKTGSSLNIDLSVRSKADSFGVVWEGYVYIPTSGAYTFETVSDEGSKLYFNSFYNPAATDLVNNDSIHLARPATGTINIPAAGVYPIAITYFDKAGADSMKVYWTGPGITRQLIPNTAFTTIAPQQTDTTAPTIPANLRVLYTGKTFVHLDWNDATDSIGVTAYDILVNGVKKYTTAESAITADSLLPSATYVFSVKARDKAGNSSAASSVITGITTAAAGGLNYRYYEGNWNTLPNFNALTPVKTGWGTDISLSVRNRADSFGIVWEGYVNIPAPGSYTFETLSDEGSKLYFNSFYAPSAAALVNNDSVHLAKSATGTVTVAAAGMYPVAVTYFDKTGADTLKVYWTGPGFTRQLLTNTAFAITPAAPPDTTAPSIPANLKVVSKSRNSISLQWDPSADNIAVTAYDVYQNSVKRYTVTATEVTADSLLSGTNYTFTVRARDSSGNVSAASAAVTAGTYSSGLTYRYYEGSWNNLPDFSVLAPVRTGTSSNTNISARPATRNDNFGFVWEGNITIPAAGTYTFETMSDDGSRLYFNSLYSPAATPLVNHDGLHWAYGVSATVNVPAAGVYPIAITYFEKDGGESMQVYWSGPGLARQLIPDAAFSGAAPQADTTAPSIPANLKTVTAGRNTIALHWDASTDNVAVIAYDIYRNGVRKYTSATNDFTADSLLPATTYTFSVKARDPAGNTSAAGNTISAATTNSGLTYRYYEGNWNLLPNFSTLTPVKTGSSANVDIGIKNRADSFGIVWEGNITIPAAGTYTFETMSDDGSRLYFNSLYSPAATPLVNHDGLHWAYGVSATVNVPAAGVYPIAITYFEKDGGESMQVYWSRPGLARQLIPDAAFSGAVSQAQTNPLSGYSARDQAAANPDMVTVYPNPFAETFMVDVYNSTAANKVSIGLYDLAGKQLYFQHAGALPAGSTTIKMQLHDRVLAPGIYIARIMINGKATKIVKLVKEK